MSRYRAMPREKTAALSGEGAPLPVAPILQRFLKTYEERCAQAQTSVCPAIRKDLKTSIDDDQVLRKFVLVKPEDSQPSPLPMSLEPLLTTIRDECYRPGKQLCLWGLQLSNPEVASLALFLESKGRTPCPLTTLELIDCKMDLWSLGRLGQALQLSGLHSLVLDYCTFGSEEIESIFSGLENNRRLQGLSLRYCGLGPPSGPRLGSVICRSAICELHLDGNYLQCSGALALLRPMAEYAETQGRGPAATASPDSSGPPHARPASQRGSSTLNQMTKSSETGTVKTTSGKKKKKKREKGIKKKMEGLTEAGPWLVKLYLADNGIDGKGKDGENSLLEFTQTLTCILIEEHWRLKRLLGIFESYVLALLEQTAWFRLPLQLPQNLIRYSAHLKELDLGNNDLGELAAIDILEALRARKTGKLQVLKVTVTPQISSDTFRSIWKSSNKSKVTGKRKKKAKH